MTAFFVKVHVRVFRGCTLFRIQQGRTLQRLFKSFLIEGAVKRQRRFLYRLSGHDPEPSVLCREHALDTVVVSLGIRLSDIYLFHGAIPSGETEQMIIIGGRELLSRFFCSKLAYIYSVNKRIGKKMRPVVIDAVNICGCKQNSKEQPDEDRLYNAASAVGDLLFRDSSRCLF